MVAWGERMRRPPAPDLSPVPGLSPARIETTTSVITSIAHRPFLFVIFAHLESTLR